MTEQEMLKRRINALDFACWELHLFLDSHPENQDAAKKLEEYKKTTSVLMEEYESKYGMLKETSENCSRWQWVSGPWPWETEE